MHDDYSNNDRAYGSKDLSFYMSICHVNVLSVYMLRLLLRVTW